MSILLIFVATKNHIGHLFIYHEKDGKFLFHTKTYFFLQKCPLVGRLLLKSEVYTGPGTESIYCTFALMCLTCYLDKLKNAVRDLIVNITVYSCHKENTL